MKLTDTWGLLLLSTLLVAVPVKAETPVRLNQCHGTDLNCAKKNGTLRPHLQASRPLEQFLSLIESGRNYRNAKNFQQAFDAFQKALQLAQQAGDLDSEWLARTDIALTYQVSGDLPKALALYEQNLALFSQHIPDFKDATKGPYTFIYISEIHTAQKSYQKAIESLRQALTLIEKLNLSPLSDSKARVLQHLGVNLFLAGNISEADSSLAAASTAYENIRKQRLGGQVPMVVDYSNEIEINRWRQQVLVAQNRTNQALELAEQNRARAFVSLLANRLNTSPKFQPTVDSPSLEQIKQIAKAENSTLVQYTVTYEFKPNGAFWSSNYEDFRPSNLFIWVIKPTGEITFRRSNLAREKLSITEIVRQARESIGARGLGVERVARVEVPQQQKGQFQKLHQLLIQPIADLLPTNPNSRVIFIPQDFLFLVPFSALQDSAGKYLIEKHTIVISPSIQVLDLTRSQQQRIQDVAKGVLIVGNPTMPSLSASQGMPPQQLPSLPGSEQEAKAIAQLFNTQPLIGNQASKTAVLQRMSGARIVHLATHGILDDVGGFFSSVALAPTSQDNGFLAAREILSLKLNTELVVLSACNTGRGQINGDGVEGLSRSFIGAGVPSVIVSLWSVPDAPTASLMTAFYQNLKSGSDKAQALRQAMLKTMKQFPNPVNWAAFTLIGEANSSSTLQATTGDVLGSSSNSGSNSDRTQAAVNYYTVFPIPDNATDYNESPSVRVPGEVDIYFHSSLSVEELVNFYRQALTQKGLTERPKLTRITKDSFQLVFTGSPNGKIIVIQGSDDYLGRNLRGVSIRFE